VVYFILNSLEKFHAITARIVEMSTKVTGRYSVHFSDLVPPQHTITVTYYCRTAWKSIRARRPKEYLHFVERTFVKLMLACRQWSELGSTGTPTGARRWDAPQHAGQCVCL